MAKKAAKKPKKRIPGMYRYIYGVLITGFDDNKRLAFDVFNYRDEAMGRAQALKRQGAVKGAKAVKLIATIARLSA